MTKPSWLTCYFTTTAWLIPAAPSPCHMVPWCTGPGNVLTTSRCHWMERERFAQLSSHQLDTRTFESLNSFCWVVCWTAKWFRWEFVVPSGIRDEWVLFSFIWTWVPPSSLCGNNCGLQWQFRLQRNATLLYSQMLVVPRGGGSYHLWRAVALEIAASHLSSAITESKVLSCFSLTATLPLSDLG